MKVYILTSQVYGHERLPIVVESVPNVDVMDTDKAFIQLRDQCLQFHPKEFDNPLTQKWIKLFLDGTIDQYL